MNTLKDYPTSAGYRKGQGYRTPCASAPACAIYGAGFRTLVNTQTFVAPIERVLSGVMRGIASGCKGTTQPTHNHLRICLAETVPSEFHCLYVMCIAV